MIAIITGASSGLGIEYAKELDGEGLSELWLVARDGDALKRVASNLKTPTKIIICDLTNGNEIDSAIGLVLESEKPHVKYCVNNAGFGKLGPLNELELSDMTSMVDLNCRAVVHLSHLVIPYMERGSTLIHTSSAASFAPLGGFAVYAATKSFVTSFSIALQAELKDSGIHSIAVCPGPIETNFSKRAHEGSVRSDSVLKKKVDANPVIKKAIADAKRGKSLSVYGVKFNIMKLLSPIISSYWMAKVTFDRIMKGANPKK